MIPKFDGSWCSGIFCVLLCYEVLLRSLIMGSVTQAPKITGNIDVEFNFIITQKCEVEHIIMSYSMTDNLISLHEDFVYT